MATGWFLLSCNYTVHNLCERLCSAFPYSSVNPPLYTQGEVRQIRQGEGTCVEIDMFALENCTKNLQPNTEGLSLKNGAGCRVFNCFVF